MPILGICTLTITAFSGFSARVEISCLSCEGLLSEGGCGAAAGSINGNAVALEQVATMVKVESSSAEFGASRCEAKGACVSGGTATGVAEDGGAIRECRIISMIRGRTGASVNS